MSSNYDPLAGHPRYRKIRSINEGTFGFVDLAQDLAAPGGNQNSRVAVKFLERGPGVNKATLREIINHRLCAGHPHIVRFQEVFLTPRYLAIVMEYASGGDMFEYVLRHREHVPVAAPAASNNNNGGGAPSAAAAGASTAAAPAARPQTVARGLPEPVARAFFQELVVAMQFCHELGIANRDIKLENALLDGGGDDDDDDGGGGDGGDGDGGESDGGDGDGDERMSTDGYDDAGPASTSGGGGGHNNGGRGNGSTGGASRQRRRASRQQQQPRQRQRRRPSLKICDFGYSKNEFVDSRPKSVSGTPDYIAPEVLLNDAYDGKKADIWSCGVMLYVMLTGSLPFAKRGDERANNLVRLQQMFPRIVAAEYERPSHVSPAAAHLLGRLLTADPASRVTLAEVAAHPWFREGLPPSLAALNATLLSALEPTARGLQSVAEIEAIVHAATRPGAPPPSAAAAAGAGAAAAGGAAGVPQQQQQQQQQPRQEAPPPTQPPPPAPSFAGPGQQQH